MPRIPDQDEFARLWSQVPMADRRRILKAVNRGRMLDRRKEAALAVVMARRQQRFWRFAWLLGPLVAVPVAVFMPTVEGLGQVAAYGLLGAAVLLAMSVYYTRRARRAEELNADHAIHGRRRR